MAKRKTEKVVDLKPKSITSEELDGLQEVVNTLNRVQMEIGSLESRKHNLLHQAAQHQEKMQAMQKSFEDIYGKVDINITDGAIAYPDDVEADS
tara:strand:+ start:430 stop:711 length:282 start_codon:yes stop_codon:yes gene_type:complete